MNRPLIVALSAASAIASVRAFGAPWIEELPPGFYVCDLSYDGSVAAGNVVFDGSYETFRWTRAGGVERLGRASVPEIGAGGGSPDVSYNGDCVSASILSSDWNVTLGHWSINSGWSEAFPPVPAHVFAEDQAYGSAWGMSGDGKHVTGYYITMNLASRVQACSWAPSGVVTDLPATRARVNAASYDGSVVGGWEDSGFGPWIPTVWRNGVKHAVSGSLGSTQVNSINLDGSVLVGDAPDEWGAMKVAAIWRWNGVEYVEQLAGYLPETSYSLGSARFTSVTDDGSIAVGINQLAFNPGQGLKAIIWTEADGLVNGEDFVASLGLSFPETFELIDFQSISPDGSVIAAAGFSADAMTFQTMLIHLREPCPADTNGDRQIDDADFVSFAGAYDMLDCSDGGMPLRCPSDLNRDGLVDDADFVLFASAYDALLCE